MTTYYFNEIFGIALSVVGVAASIASLVGAFRSGVWKKVKSGDIRADSPNPILVAQIAEAQKSTASSKPMQFETEQLASYYSQVLGQAKISFWFSLIFASLGFLIIVWSVFMFSNADNVGAVLKLLSGLVIDAVAALFFVQSKRAQESMSSFFDKLRTDRLTNESMQICNNIKNQETKDKLMSVLALHYSGIDSSCLIEELRNNREQ